jgi:hypothetical protein
MRSPPELPLPSPESAKETSQSFSFSKQGNLAIDLISQRAPINFWETPERLTGSFSPFVVCIRIQSKTPLSAIRGRGEIVWQVECQKLNLTFSLRPNRVS